MCRNVACNVSITNADDPLVLFGDDYFRVFRAFRVFFFRNWLRRTSFHNS